MIYNSVILNRYLVKNQFFSNYICSTLILGTYESLMKSKGALFDFVQDHIVDEETNTINKDQRNDLTKIQEQEKPFKTEDTER